jgi:hypothetical protein
VMTNGLTRFSTIPRKGWASLPLTLYSKADKDFR